MTTRQRMSFQLLDLPNEVISLILNILDTGSPFNESIIDVPRPPKLADDPSLKHCSLLSHRLRRLTLPILFHHAYLNPQYLRTFITFLETNSLTPHVISLVAYLPAPCSHYHPPWWAMVLDSLPTLKTISILAPPHNFFEITGASTPSTESWAFNIKHQILSFSYDLTSNTSTESLASALPSSLLTARPWTSFTLNEASALKCYTTYEYFLRRTPSPIYSIPSTTLSLPPLPNPFLANLRSFSFVAIFPLYNHVESVLQRVKRMTNLRKLFVKLLPEPNSTILNDEIKAAIGQFDMRDPWQEFDTSLALIASACVEHREHPSDESAGSGVVMANLEELKIDDVKMLGVKDNIEEIVNRHLTELVDLGWAYKGEGVWKRTTNIQLAVIATDND